MTQLLLYHFQYKLYNLIPSYLEGVYGVSFQHTLVAQANQIFYLIINMVEIGYILQILLLWLADILHIVNFLRLPLVTIRFLKRQIFGTNVELALAPDDKKYIIIVFFIKS